MDYNTNFVKNVCCYIMSSNAVSGDSVIIHMDDQSSPKEADMEDVEITVNRHIRRNSGSFGGNTRSIDHMLAGIGEVSHPNVQALKPAADSEEPVSVDSQWNVGSCHCTKSLVVFVINVIFSSTVVVFCIIKLCSPTLTAGDKTLYLSLLTGTVSLYSPSPFQGKSKK